MKKLLRASLLTGLLCVLASASQAQILFYTATLTGPAESPSNASPGTGFTTVTINVGANTMRVQSSFTGLTGNTTASHIHAATAAPGEGTAGVATQTPSFAGFPLGVTSGSMDTMFDMTLTSSFNAAYVTANGGTAASAFTALRTSIANGTAYVNIHTTAFPGGEIRGFLAPASAPEPGTLALVLLGGMGVLIYRRKVSR